MSPKLFLCQTLSRTKLSPGCGLGLTCIATKAQALLLKQILRILASPEEVCSRHIGFWLGNLLQDSFPHLAQLGPTSPALVPRLPLHAVMLEVLEEGLARQEYEPGNLECTTTKSIYKSRAEDVFLRPKIEEKYPDVDFQCDVYPRLNFRILEAETKDTVFCLVHSLVYNKKRMFHQGRAQDPYCPPLECEGQVQDLEHLFCSCCLVAEAWAWLRSRLLQILPTTRATSNKELILLQFPADTMDQECTWILGNYFRIVTTSVTGRKRNLRAEVLAGWLRCRLDLIKGRAVVQPRLFNS